MHTQAQSTTKSSPEREWWLRTLAVFQSPRAVFAALRDDSAEQAEARQEPVLALVLLAGLAGVLLAPSTGELLDEPLVENSFAVLAVILFFTGAIYGAATYWIGGAALFVGLKGAGSRASYRRARHLLAYAAAPLILGLALVWPVRLAVHGADSFRAGGADNGVSVTAFDAALGVFSLWALALLLYGVSVAERWSLVRAAVSLALMLLAIVIVTLPFLVPLSSR